MNRDKTGEVQGTRSRTQSSRAYLPPLSIYHPQQREQRCQFNITRYNGGTGRGSPCLLLLLAISPWMTYEKVTCPSVHASVRAVSTLSKPKDSEIDVNETWHAYFLVLGHNLWKRNSKFRSLRRAGPRRT